MGFSAGGKRFFDYLEIVPHVDEAAWDHRSIATRVSTDIRRDFMSAMMLAVLKGGMVGCEPSEEWRRPFFDRLTRFLVAIQALEVLLMEHGSSEERVFHEFLAKNPMVMDVYGTPVSKPRFQYPVGDSPLRKEFVEPDL